MKEPKSWFRNRSGQNEWDQIFLGRAIPAYLDSKKPFKASLIDRDAKAFENWLVIHCQNTTPPLDEKKRRSGFTNNFPHYRGMKWGFTLEANRVPFSKNIFTEWAADVASLQGQEVLPTLPKMLLLHSKHKTNSILVSGTPLLTPCMYVLTTSLKDG